MQKKGRKNALFILLAALTLITMLFTSCEEKIPVNLTLAGLNEMVGAKTWDGANYNLMNEAEKAKFREDIKSSPDWCVPDEPAASFTLISLKHEGFSLVQDQAGCWYRNYDGMSIPLNNGDDPFTLPVYFSDFTGIAENGSWDDDTSFASISDEERARFTSDMGEGGKWQDALWKDGAFSIRNAEHPDFTIMQEADGTWKSVCYGIETVLAAGTDPYEYPVTFDMFVNIAAERVWPAEPKFSLLSDSEKENMVEKAAAGSEWRVSFASGTFEAESLLNEGYVISQEADGKWYSTLSGARRELRAGNDPFAPLLTLADFETVIAGKKWEISPDFTLMSEKERTDFSEASGAAWTLLDEEGVFAVESSEHAGFTLRQDSSGRWSSTYDGIGMDLGAGDDPWRLPIRYSGFKAALDGRAWNASVLYPSMTEGERNRFSADAEADGGAFALGAADDGRFLVTSKDHAGFTIIQDKKGKWWNSYDGIEVPLAEGDEPFTMPFLASDLKTMIEDMAWDRTRNWNEISENEINAIKNEFTSYGNWAIVNGAPTFTFQIVRNGETWRFSQSADLVWTSEFEASTRVVNDGEDPFTYPPCGKVFKSIEKDSRWSDPMNFTGLNERAQSYFRYSLANGWTAEWTEEGLTIGVSWRNAKLFQNKAGTWFSVSNGLSVPLEDGQGWSGNSWLSYSRWLEWIGAKEYDSFLCSLPLNDTELEDLKNGAAGKADWTFSQEKDATSGNWTLTIKYVPDSAYTFYFRNDPSMRFWAEAEINGKTFFHHFTNGEDVLYDYIDDKTKAEWNIHEETADGIVLEEYKGQDTVVDIPSTYRGKPVIGLYRSFSMNETVTKVTLSSSVREIGYCAFWNCPELTEIVSTSNVVELGASSIMGNPKLGSVGDLSGVVTIEFQGLADNPALKDVGPLTALKTVGKKAFYKAAFESLDLPKGLETIGDQAFMKATVPEVRIPSTVTYVGSEAFAESTGIKVIVSSGADISLWQKDDPNDYNIRPWAQGAAELVFEDMPTDGDIVYEYNWNSIFAIKGLRNPESTAPVTISEKIIHGIPVSRIKSEAFKDAKTASITIDAPGIVDAEWMAMSGWRTPGATLTIKKGTDRGLWERNWFTDTTATLVDENVIDGKWYAVEREDSVSIHGSLEPLSGNVVIPDTLNGKNVTAIRKALFDGHDKTGITSVKLPKNIEWIGAWVFSSMVNVPSITIPSTVKWIGERAFVSMSPTSEILIEPGAPYDEWEQSWDDTDARIILNWDPSSDWGWKEIGNSIFITGYIGSGTDVTVPDTLKGKKVTRIDDKAFYMNETVEKVTVPSTVTDISNTAFLGCTNLTEIVLPDSQFYSFVDGCLLYRGNTLMFGSRLCTRIPSAVTSIKDEAFMNQPIAELIVPSTVTDMGRSVFSGWKENQLIKIEQGSPIKMDNRYEWDGGSADIFMNWKDESSVWGYTINDDNETITLTYCALTGTSIDIPKSVDGKKVTGIGDGLFKDRTDLTAVTIPSGVTTICWQAFTNCKGLSELIIPATVREIQGYAFSHCTGISRMELPAGVSLGSEVFYCWTSGQLVYSEDASLDGPAWAHAEHRHKFGWIRGTDWCAVPTADGTGMILTGYIGSPEVDTVAVPQTLGGKPVKESGEYCLTSDKWLRKVTLPEGFEVLGPYFVNTMAGSCPTLIEVPSTVRKIDYQGGFDASTTIRVNMKRDDFIKVEGYPNLTAGQPNMVYTDWPTT